MPQCVPLRMWQHQLGVGCTWVIMRVAKPDCSAQLTQPRGLSRDLLLILSPMSVGLYLPLLGTHTLKSSCFVYRKCMENVWVLPNASSITRDSTAYQEIQKHMLANTFLFVIHAAEKNVLLSLWVFICYLFTAGRFKEGIWSTCKKETLAENWFIWLKILC